VDQTVDCLFNYDTSRSHVTDKPRNKTGDDSIHTGDNL
jgi:hypothetical protein